MGTVESLEYSELAEQCEKNPPNADVLNTIQRAFGQSGKGLIIVNNIPQLQPARNSLFASAVSLANLRSSELASLEDPSSSYLFGWALGKENPSGKSESKDTSKASFYANPFADDNGSRDSDMHRYPSLARPNRWPRDSLPQLEPAFKRAASILRDTGEKVALLCDWLAAPDGEAGSLQRRVSSLLRSPEAHKGRLLTYFPQQGGEHCQLHRDHSVLTGLCKPRFSSRTTGEEVPPPDADAGLYIRERDGSDCKVTYPVTSAIFQLGEAAQIVSGGTLESTPHYVAAPKVLDDHSSIRNAFALFMQPHWSTKLDPPPGMSTTGVAHYVAGNTFGEFSETKCAEYY
jgi:isopenicillin N synthase-like dioxygenase